MATIDRLPSGSYRVRVVTPKGRRIAQTHRVSKAAAKTIAARLEVAASLGELDAEVEAAEAKVDVGTLDELVAEYMTGGGRGWTDETRRNHEGRYRNHVAPILGDRRLDQITAAHLDRLYADLLDGGLGTGAVHNVHTFLSGAFAQAVRWGRLVASPTAAATAPAQPESEVDPPTPEEVQTLLAAAVEVDERWGALVRLAVATGARQAELVALDWTDVDLDAGRIAIGRTGRTKTRAGRRTVTIDVRTVEVLAALDRPVPFLFWDAYGNRLTPGAASQRWAAMRRDVAAAGLLPDHPGVRFHDLRHFHATQLLAAGVDVRTVAGRLGHAKPSMTLDVYAAWVPSADEAAAQAIGALLS